MDIKPYDKTIRDLLGSKRQFLIPRFQRAYSWDKKNYQEFYEDMLGNLVLNNEKIASSQYFLGTMLFIGNFAEGTDQEIQVVDGQQRLTTITILFSALSDRFRELGESTLSKQIFKYIMTRDDDGKEVRVLKSKTNYPFFAYFIQDINKETAQNANSEEESCIEETYKYFKKKLAEENLKSFLKRKFRSESVDRLSEVEILKALRDQVLNSTFVSISTADREQANRVFEILKTQEPADFAEETWRQIKATLNSGKETVGLATFYRHYWISKYKKTYTNDLYDAFKENISKTEDTYREFLTDMLKNARVYMQIVNPKREDYNNRKEYYWLVQSLNSLNNDFNIVQVRIALLALFDVKERKIIDTKIFKQTILYLENFHFAYNAIISGRANKLEKIYSTFAIAVRKASTKAAAKTIISDKLIKPLEDLFPAYEDFYKKFIALTYSKSDLASNVKTKYAINKVNTLYTGKETFEDDGSIEHLISEVEGDYALSIGNLILLEQSINSDAGDKDYEQKKEYYARSNYKWVKDFCSEHPTWASTMINGRRR